MVGYSRFKKGRWTFFLKTQEALPKISVVATLYWASGKGRDLSVLLNKNQSLFCTRKYSAYPRHTRRGPDQKIGAARVFEFKLI